MFDKSLWRTAAVVLVCLALAVFNAQDLWEPEHRLTALAVVMGMVILAVFFELSARQVRMEWSAVAMLGVIVCAALAWGALGLIRPLLPNDSAALMPADNHAESGCALPARALQVAVGGSWVSGPSGGFTPFRSGTCSGPMLSRTANGLSISAVGYDSDGTAIFQIRDNQFSLLVNDYLHLHRPDRSSIGVYDRAETEILYVRYLAPNAVRVRGRFLCGDAPLVRVTQTEVIKNDRVIAMPSCNAGTVRF